MGHRNKDVAKLYDVSPSYVSKLKTGKKVPDVHIIHGPGEWTTYTDNNIVEWLELKIQNLDKERNIYVQILAKEKGE